MEFWGALEFNSSGGWQDLIQVFTEDPSETLPSRRCGTTATSSVWVTLSDRFPEGQYGAGRGGNLTVDTAGRHHLSQVIRFP